MKNWKFLAVMLVSMFALSACNTAPKVVSAGDMYKADNYLMSPAQINSLLADQKTASGLNVLDVRTPAEFQTECLDGAKMVDFEAPDFDTKIAGLDKNANYLVYCRTGRRSGLVVSKMRGLGFKNIVELKGGINAWKADGEKVNQNCR